MMMVDAIPLAPSDPPSRKLAFHEGPGPLPRQFFLYRPQSARAGAPLVISVHGIARNAATHAYRLMDEAERFGLTIAAPFFSKDHYGQYQQLQDAKTGARSDLALLDIAEAAARLSGASAEKLLLFGFSGGAQFAQRFVMAHPQRVASAVIVAAGWYTFPDVTQPYPYGLDLSSPDLDIEFDLRGMLETPQHVMVGELDIVRDSSLRASKRLDQMQGLTRLERARRWVEAMGEFHKQRNALGAPTLTTLPGVEHDFAEVAERAQLPRLIFDKFATDSGLAPLERY